MLGDKIICDRKIIIVMILNINKLWVQNISGGISTSFTCYYKTTVTKLFLKEKKIINVYSSDFYGTHFKKG